MMKREPEGGPGYEGNPPVFIALADLPEAKGKRTTETRAYRLDTVGWLLHHKQIETHQADAARKLQTAYEKMSQGFTSAMTGRIGGGSFGAAEAAMHSRISGVSDYERALQSLGPLAAKLVHLVVIDGYTVAKAAARLEQGSSGQRGASFALQVALDTLARHYRLA